MLKKRLSILVIATVFLMGSTQVLAETSTTEEGSNLKENGTNDTISGFEDLTDAQKSQAIIDNIPNEIKVDIKESEFFVEELDTINASDPGINYITEQIQKILTDKGFDLTDDDFNLFVYMGGYYEDIHNIDVAAYYGNYTNEIKKTIKVTYNNTKDYDEKTAKMIEDYLSNVTLEDTTSTYNIIDAQSLYNLSIEGRTHKMANDLGVKIIIDHHKGGGEPNEYYDRSCLYFLKNDVLYAAKNFHIHIIGVDGPTSYVNEVFSNVTVDTSKDFDVAIAAEKLDNASKDYLNIVETAKKDGYDNILNAYELYLVKGEINDSINIVFNVGTEYNGKKALVLHLKKDGTYQKVEKQVVDGKIDIDVNELSPFLVAVKDGDRVLDDVPKTSDNNIIMILSILTLMTLSLLTLSIKIKD